MGGWQCGFPAVATTVSRKKNSKMNAEKSRADDFLELFRNFGALPHEKQNLTFMEVSGYPHYENVCSNILGFYLDPNQQHGLKDLFVTAIFKITENFCSTNVQSVTREFGTTGGRLDLLVEGDEFILAIENKIFHWLANDLNDYAKAVNSHGNQSKQQIKIVLGLSDIQDPKLLRDGFVSCTYAQLWKEITSLLGSYIAKANPKWVTYLLDFIETTTNLAGANMELKETDRFFIKHEEVISALLLERNSFLGRLTQKIATLCNLMKEVPEKDLLATEPYLYSTDRFVMDFKGFKSFQTRDKISFDFYLMPSGWNLQLFGRTTPAHYYLLNLVKQPSLEEKMRKAVLKDRRFYVQNWSVDTDLSLIRDELCKWLTAVNEANRTFVNQQPN
jgi:PD-(D/E)XK nuclease superfamily